jgi:hypothetical protein
MPFNKNYQYGTQADGISHNSVAPNGRRVVTADFAVMYIGNQSIGLVQRFTPSETRPVQPQFEIGNIYPVEFIPQPWQGTLQVSRLEIFKNFLYKAFGFDNGIADYGLTQYWPQDKLVNGKPVVTSLADIQWPIDISLHITNPPAVGTITVKSFKECWITQSGTSYDSGAKVVAENVSFTFRTVTYDEVSLDSIQGLANTPV